MSHINNFKNRYSLWKSLRHCTWTSLHEVVWSAILPVFPLLHFDPLAGRSPSEISEVLADGLFSCNSLKKTFNFIDQIYLNLDDFTKKRECLQRNILTQRQSLQVPVIWVSEVFVTLLFCHLLTGELQALSCLWFQPFLFL